jgi:hypothetical protein
MSARNWWDELPKASPMDAALQAEGVTGPLADLARSIYAQESGSGTNTKTSNAGARGGMQILPGTFREVAGKDWDIDDPLDNARAGVRYIKALSKKADGDPTLTAVGYYGGPGGMDKARRGEAVSDPRNPKAPNTLQYAQQVVDRMQKTTPQATQATTKAADSGDWWRAMPEAEKAATAPAEKAQPAKAPTSTGSQLARQVGLTARAGITGLASLPAMLSDAVTGPINAGMDLVRGDGNGFRFKSAGAAVNDVLTSAGLPQPENATERITQDVVGGMAGAGAFVGAGKALAGAGSEVAKAVGKTLSAGPGLQVASAGTGMGAAGTVREEGGGGGAQIAAGLAGALIPAVGPAAAGAAVRGVLRGGEAGRQAVADRVAMFQGAGTQPTIGQATGGRVTRATESVLGKVPGGAGVINEYATKQSDDMARAVQALSDELAPGASAANAGEAITRGVNAFKGGMKAIQSKLYRDLDQHIPANTRIGVDNTSRALADLNEGIPGASGLSKMFANTKIGGIEKALLQDLDDAALLTGSGGLPYEAVKKLRTLVGNELADGSLLNDVPRAQWARLYGALSDDLGVAATNAGPQAQSVWHWANTYTKTQLQRLEELSGIVGRDSPEKVFQAAIAGTAEGDTIARRVISALPKSERREVAAAVLQRLGRATPGQQNAVGDAFSSETFLTNLSKLSPAARNTLFGRTDLDGVLDRMGQFAGVADVLRDGKRIFANSSGTATATAQIGLGSGIAGGVVAAAAGQPLPLAAALAVPAAANAGARLMTSERLVNMAATPTTMAQGAGASVLGAGLRVDSDATQQAPEPQWWEQLPTADGGEGGGDAPITVMQATQGQAKDPLMDGPMQRLSEATDVDSAIRAIHEPSTEQKEQVRSEREAEETQRQAQQEARAQQAKEEAAREALVSASQQATQASEDAKTRAVAAIMANGYMAMTKRRALAQDVVSGTADPVAAYEATPEGKAEAKAARVAAENKRFEEMRAKAKAKRKQAELDRLEAQRPANLLSR